MRTRFVDSVKDAFKQNGYGNFGSGTEEGDLGGVFIISVAGTGRIFSMDSDFHIAEADVPYMSEGAGAELALGSLFTSSSLRIPKKRVRTALEAATKFNMSVRPPYTIIEV